MPRREASVAGNDEKRGVNSMSEMDYTSLAGCQTMAALFQKRCQQYGDRIAHREKHFGIWQAYSWNDYYCHAQWIALALVELGLKKGDVLSILSEDKREWLYFDMAAICVGAIPSGVYTTDAAAQLAYLIEDSNSTFLVVENDEQLDKYLQIRDKTPSLKKVIVLERKGLLGFSDPMVIFLDQLYERGRLLAQAQPHFLQQQVTQIKPESIRMLIYTSGTTGKPKGTVITHANILYQLNAIYQWLESDERDEVLCFLPLCHVVERLFSVDSQLAIGMTVNFVESPETLFENLQEVSPHTFFAVPRVWEKIYSRVQIMRQEGTALGRFAFDCAVAVGHQRSRYTLQGERVPTVIAWRYRLWDLLVLRNVRRLLGMNRLRRANCGAAPISPELLEWYSAIGVPLWEGYGQTECSGVATFNNPGHARRGSVGRAIPGSQIRLNDTGEIEIYGPHIFHSYLNRPEKSAETVTEDGWLRTGDLGEIDQDGYLTITGRLKDIIITAGGKNITPAEIESALKFSTYISDAIVIGDKRKYLTALIMIDQENVEYFAQTQQIPFTDFASLCAAEPIVALIEQVVAEVNRQFARVEQIKQFRLIDTLLTAEDEELTPTMKLKRGFVEQRHADLIESMYR